MDRDKKGHIRYLKNKEDISISEIARRMNIARKTVRRALKEEPQTKQIKRPSKLDPYKNKIKEILTTNPNISNVLILEKIKEEGYTGQKSILGEYLKGVRGKKEEAFNHLVTLPGEEAQVDWASCGSISCGKHQRKLYLFCMVLSYSRYMFTTFTTSMDSDTFMACHIKAFRYFSGVPQSLLYDNLKSVVSYRHGKEIIFNQRFSDFSSFYGFKIKVCNVRRGNEKGKVERAIRYIKGNFLNRATYENFMHIKDSLRIWLKETANKRLHSTMRKIPLEIFENEEKEYLLILSENDYDYPKIRQLHSNKDCLFTFETNRYSIPAQYYNETLFFKAYNNIIKIIHKDKVIATHKRTYDKYEIIKDPKHYESLNNRKIKARQSADIERFNGLCPQAAEYLKGLAKTQYNTNYHVRQILSFLTIFDKPTICSAINDALSYDAYHWEFIKNILFSRYRSGGVVQPVSLDKDELMTINVSQMDLSQYDKLS
jgi:transposase